MAQDPLREACWRFEQISPLLEPQLTASERRRMIEEMGRVCVVWPSGREAPIPKSTTYRWLRAYRKDPRIESLMRQGRKRQAKAIKPEWVQHALALLEEEADRSLFILCLRIKLHFDLPRAPSRASLQRALTNQPRYIKLKRRARGERKLRRRFQARKPHDIWHADAKGAFMVQFTDGVKQKVQVLTILDDATRFVLAALVVLSESLGAAVATFRAAAARWGLVRFSAIQVLMCKPIALQDYLSVAQFSIRRPATRENSATLLVTSVTSRLNACAAIIMSRGPIMLPLRSRVARIGPYISAA